MEIPVARGLQRKLTDGLPEIPSAACFAHYPEDLRTINHLNTRKNSHLLLKGSERKALSAFHLMLPVPYH